MKSNANYNRVLLNIFIVAIVNLCFSISATATKNDSKNPKIQYQHHVNKLIQQIEPQNIESFLRALTHFPDRAAQSKNGVVAANWIEMKLRLLADDCHRRDIKIFRVETNEKNMDDVQVSFPQPSIVIKIGYSNDPGVLIGAHFDTYPIYDQTTSEEYCKIISDPIMRKNCVIELMANKPGADDDGSGSAIIFELARILLKSDLQFKKPIYLVWYAAEEDGFVGSRSVSTYFQKKNLPLLAAMQLDQAGFAFQNDHTIWLVNNYVDNEMTAYLAALINEYVGQPVKYTFSKGPASDNYSWYKKNIPVVFPFEAEMSLGKGNMAVHTHDDTIEKLSMTHMLDFTKLALAFVIELADPIDTKTEVIDHRVC